MLGRCWRSVGGAYLRQVLGVVCRDFEVLSEGGGDVKLEQVTAINAVVAEDGHVLVVPRDREECLYMTRAPVFLDPFHVRFLVVLFGEEVN